MARRKQEKKEFIAKSANVFEFGNKEKVVWKEYFGNDNPIVLELGCGHGDYTLEMARMFPDKNFVGVDVKGPRISVGVKKALEEKLSNAAFIRAPIQSLGDFFSKGEVDSIWITFPDPQPKPCRAQKRLTSARQIDLYSKFLKPGGKINLKTDSELIYDFTLETIQELDLKIETKIDDLYEDKKTVEDPLLRIQTFYEKRHLEEGRRIMYVSFRL